MAPFSIAALAPVWCLCPSTPPLCPWSDGKASGFRGQRNRNSLSPFSPEEAGITKVKRTPSFSAKANDTFHLQETLAGFEIPLFDEKLHSNSAQFKSVFTAKTPWMSAAFPWFYVYIQHQTVVPLLGLSKPQLRHQPRFFQIILMCTRTAGRTRLGFSEEELQVSATQNAMVLHIAGNVHSAGTVHSAVDLHVVVDGVQVFLFILKQKHKQRLLWKFKELIFNKNKQSKLNTFSIHLWLWKEVVLPDAFVSSGSVILLVNWDTQRTTWPQTDCVKSIVV